MTAIALPRNVGATSGSSLPDATAALRRITGTWSEPEPWTVAVLLVTGVVVLARHPLARMIGTEVPDESTTPSIVATAPAAVPTTGTAPRTGAAIGVFPTHAPRDPFRALVRADGKVLAPETVTGLTGAAARHPAAAAAAPAAAKPAPRPAPHPASTCSGTVHHVVSGDTLWTLAARAVKSSDAGRINIAWHRIYSENRASIGSNPSLLPVGTTLCLPSSH